LLFVNNNKFCVSSLEAASSSQNLKKKFSNRKVGNEVGERIMIVSPLQNVFLNIYI
jgi:hypothetical protein